VSDSDHLIFIFKFTIDDEVGNTLEFQKLSEGLPRVTRGEMGASREMGHHFPKLLVEAVRDIRIALFIPVKRIQRLALCGRLKPSVAGLPQPNRVFKPSPMMRAGGAHPNLKRF